VSILKAYAQPSPRPGEAVVKHVRSIVDQLSSDDFLQREAAEAQLVNMGKIVVPLLRDWRASLPLEGQQRTDSILKKLDATGQQAGPK
jgi:hypothetical protein